MIRPRQARPFSAWPTRRVHELVVGDRIWVHAYNRWMTVAATFVADPEPSQRRHSTLGTIELAEAAEPYPCSPDTPYATQLIDEKDDT